MLKGQAATQTYGGILTTDMIDPNDQETLDKMIAEGFSPWSSAVTIDKKMVEEFLALTSVPQDSANIPGIMLQALLPKMTPGDSWKMIANHGVINLGCPSIRFPKSVKSDAQFQGRGRLAATRGHKKGVITTMAFEIREMGDDTPCLESTMEILYLTEAP